MMFVDVFFLLKVGEINCMERSSSVYMHEIEKYIFFFH